MPVSSIASIRFLEQQSAFDQVLARFSKVILGAPLDAYECTPSVQIFPTRKWHLGYSITGAPGVGDSSTDLGAQYGGVFKIQLDENGAPIFAVFADDGMDITSTVEQYISINDYPRTDQDSPPIPNFTPGFLVDAVGIRSQLIPRIILKFTVIDTQTSAAYGTISIQSLQINLVPEFLAVTNDVPIVRVNNGIIVTYQLRGYSALGRLDTVGDFILDTIVFTPVFGNTAAQISYTGRFPLDATNFNATSSVTNFPNIRILESANYGETDIELKYIFNFAVYRHEADPVATDEYIDSINIRRLKYEYKIGYAYRGTNNFNPKFFTVTFLAGATAESLTIGQEYTTLVYRLSPATNENLLPDLDWDLSARSTNSAHVKVHFRYLPGLTTSGYYSSHSRNYAYKFEKEQFSNIFILKAWTCPRIKIRSKRWRSQEYPYPNNYALMLDTQCLTEYDPTILPNNSAYVPTSFDVRYMNLLQGGSSPPNPIDFTFADYGEVSVSKDGPDIYSDIFTLTNNNNFENAWLICQPALSNARSDTYAYRHLSDTDQSTLQQYYYPSTGLIASTIPIRGEDETCCDNFCSRTARSLSPSNWFWGEDTFNSQMLRGYFSFASSETIHVSDQNIKPWAGTTQRAESNEPIYRLAGDYTKSHYIQGLDVQQNLVDTSIFPIKFQLWPNNLDSELIGSNRLQAQRLLDIQSSSDYYGDNLTFASFIDKDLRKLVIRNRTVDGIFLGISRGDDRNPYVNGISLVTNPTGGTRDNPRLNQTQLSSYLDIGYGGIRYDGSDRPIIPSHTDEQWANVQSIQTYAMSWDNNGVYPKGRNQRQLNSTTPAFSYRRQNIIRLRAHRSNNTQEVTRTVVFENFDAQGNPKTIDDFKVWLNGLDAHLYITQDHKILSLGALGNSSDATYEASRLPFARTFNNTNGTVTVQKQGNSFIFRSQPFISVDETSAINQNVNYLGFAWPISIDISQQNNTNIQGFLNTINNQLNTYVDTYWTQAKFDRSSISAAKPRLGINLAYSGSYSDLLATQSSNFLNSTTNSSILLNLTINGTNYSSARVLNNFAVPFISIVDIFVNTTSTFPVGSLVRDFGNFLSNDQLRFVSFGTQTAVCDEQLSFNVAARTFSNNEFGNVQRSYDASEYATLQEISTAINNDLPFLNFTVTPVANAGGWDGSWNLTSKLVAQTVNIVENIDHYLTSNVVQEYQPREVAQLITFDLIFDNDYCLRCNDLCAVNYAECGQCVYDPTADLCDDGDSGLPSGSVKLVSQNLQVAIGGYQKDGIIYTYNSPNDFFEPVYNTIFQIEYNTPNAEIVYILVRTRKELSNGRTRYTSVQSCYSGFVEYSNGLDSIILDAYKPTEDIFTDSWTEDFGMPTVFAIPARSLINYLKIDDDCALQSLDVKINNAPASFENIGFLAVNKNNSTKSQTQSRIGLTFGLVLDSIGSWDVLLSPGSVLRQDNVGSIYHDNVYYVRESIEFDETFEMRIEKISVESLLKSVSLISLPNNPQVWVLRIDSEIKKYLIANRLCDITIDIRIIGLNTNVITISRVRIYRDYTCVYDIGLCNSFWNLSDPPQSESQTNLVLQNKLIVESADIYDCSVLPATPVNNQLLVDHKILFTIKNIPTIKNGNCLLVLKGTTSSVVTNYNLPPLSVIQNYKYKNCDSIISNTAIADRLNSQYLLLPNTQNALTRQSDIISALNTENSYMYVRPILRFPTDDKYKDLGANEVVICGIGYQFKNWKNGFLTDYLAIGFEYVFEGEVYNTNSFEFSLRYYYYNKKS